MSRLHLRFYLALHGSLIAFAVIAGLFWHLGGREALGHSVYAIVLAFGALALIVGIIAYPLVRRLTKRLERLQRGVESLGAGDLSARVPVEGSDEVARLAHSFNRAAERIEALVGAHKTLLANASHELRTPLARIRMAAELMKPGSDPRRQAGLEQDIAELDCLIDEILLASRLDAVAELDAGEEIDLLALAAEECARYAGVQLDGDDVVLRADARLLRRLLRNLLENAQRHGQPPTQVRITKTAAGAQIAVSDRGAAIPPEERARLFEPFYRRAGAASTGTGIGLALVRQIAAHHGGSVGFAETDDGCNSVVVVLPLVRERGAERAFGGDGTSACRSSDA
jgi:signal transduction histidine kinase